MALEGDKPQKPMNPRREGWEDGVKVSLSNHDNHGPWVIHSACCALSTRGVAADLESMIVNDIDHILVLANTCQ